MKSPSTSKRTVSTGVTRSILPKIYLPAPQDPPNPLGRQLFGRNASIYLSKKQLSAHKQRVATQITTTHRQRKHNNSAFPKFSRHIQKMLQPQIDQILEMFKAINQLRQKHGIISLKEDGQGEDYYFQVRQIPYNPLLREMNDQIQDLKRQIQDKMSKILKMVKPYPKIKEMIQKLLQQYSQDTLNQNSKVGKISAMKAQRRLIVANMQKIQKIKRM